MPSHGMMITKITHSVLAPPPRSLLRKMSPRIQNRHMNQAKNRKNSNKASRNEPLSSNIGTSHGGRSGGCHRFTDAALCNRPQMASPDPDEMTSDFKY